MPGGLAARFRAPLLAALVCAVVALSPPVRAQNPAGPIRLPANQINTMPLTVENKCPHRESFTVTTSGLPDYLIKPVGPLEIQANSAREFDLVVSTFYPPGLYRGEIIVTCTTCGSECKQDRRTFPVQFLIEAQAGGAPGTETIPPPAEPPPAGNPPPTTVSPSPANPPTGTPPPQTTSKPPCPCTEKCREAIGAESLAQGALEEYEHLSGMIETLESAILSLQKSSYQNTQLAKHYEDMGGYADEVQRLRKEAKEQDERVQDLQKQLEDYKQRAANAAKDADRKALLAAEARLSCDDCLARHPECPRSPWTTAGFTTETPPDPEAPYLHEVPLPPPPPTRPPEHPADGHPPHDNDKVEDCPERHRGCVALLIDMLKNESLYQKYPGFKVDLAGRLDRAGCLVDYEQPDFQRYPAPFKMEFSVGGTSVSLNFDPPDALYKQVDEHNAAEWVKLTQAITDHRTAVAKGVELAIELLDAHGSGKWDVSFFPEERCGHVGPGYLLSRYLYRAEFHEGNYQAANKHVCGWFTADFSCFSGLTPKVVDELENLGTSTCKAASTLNCGNHAGWETDGSMASATSVQSCVFYTSGQQQKLIAQALDRQSARRGGRARADTDFTGLIDDLNRIQRGGTSFYADRGYAKDHPPRHAHAGYGTRSAPAPCVGGQCE